MNHHWLVYAARAFALIWSGWWTLFGLLSGFGEGYNVVGTILHAAFPGLFFLLAAFVVWKWELVGAFLLLSQALLALFVFSFARTPIGFMTLTLPPALAAILLLIYWLKQRRAKSNTVGLKPWRCGNDKSPVRTEYKSKDGCAERSKMEDSTAKLERMYIEEYLKTKGLDWKSVRALADEECKKILTGASTYASVKLAEVEGRAKVVEELHGTRVPSSD